MKKMFAAVLFLSLLTTAAFAHQFSGRSLSPTVVPKVSSLAAVASPMTPTLIADGSDLPPVKQPGGGGGQAVEGSFTASPTLVADGGGLPPVKQSGGGGGGQAV